MSSRSQSSSRRSSSRHSSSRSGKSKNNPASKKTAAQNGANFWVMLVGFVSGLTVFLLVFSMFTKPPINQDMLTANDDNRAEVATRVEKEDFDVFVENANIKTLAATLISLQEARQFANEDKYYVNYQRQQKIIDCMMEMPLSEANRRLAVLSRVKGISTMFWRDQKKPVGEADLAVRLREVTETHSEDSDPEIAFESRIGLARLNSLEASEQAVPHAKELHQLLVDFPTNERVHATIKSSFILLVAQAENRPATLKVLNHFLKQPKVTGDQATEDLYALLGDLWNLCDLNFFDSFENVKFTGTAGRDQLREVCLDLAEIPTAGSEIVGQIRKSAEWMEAEGYYETAIDIYRALTTCGMNRPNKEAVAATKRQGEWGIKRCEAVGKPFDLATSMYDGNPLKLSLFDSMPVLIVFWSRSDNTESLLFSVEAASKRWRRKSVKIIAVQVETDSINFNRQLTRKKSEQLPGWSFCNDDGSGTGPIFSQIPRVQNGRIVLLDRSHKLYDVNVNLKELVTSVNGVLATRNEKKVE